MSLYNEVLPEFRRFNANLIGLSVDGAWCHMAYAKNNKLRFPLMSDFEPKGDVARTYGVYRQTEWSLRARALRDRFRRDHSVELRLTDRSEPRRRWNSQRSRSASFKSGEDQC